MTICAAAGALGLTTGRVAAAASASHRPVSVRPRSGSPATTFTVAFRAPDRTGKVGGEERYYVVSASGPSGGHCVAQVTRDAGASRAHARVRVELLAGGQGWCAGAFHGSVTEQERPVCPYREVCPAYVLQVKTIGKFRFRVRVAPPGGDTTPPVFAGLRSATACTPGPQRPGETTPYHLRWNAAHDDVTPSSQVVYDIFMSNTSGGEDFSEPDWTTAPGALTFTTPGLPSHGTVYFVVRARDRAGNEDHNRVERQGVDPCL